MRRTRPCASPRRARAVTVGGHRRDTPDARQAGSVAARATATQRVRAKGRRRDAVDSVRARGDGMRRRTADGTALGFYAAARTEAGRASEQQSKRHSTDGLSSCVRGPT
uniref:Uncharacterized protein n=1 Tax=Arundo donax TaxID=35708 RepID=A0A0A9FY51_ARUDO